MITLLLMVLTHFVSDFLLQSRKMGEGKSTDWTLWGQHVAIILVCFLPFGWKFAAINAIIHGLIDRNIWNLYKWSVKLRIAKHDVKQESLFDQNGNWQYYKDHLFYSTIGLDQFLHTSTIVLLWELLK